jgi:glycosyltransferase involved in cell wall biosynthesis
MSKLQKRVAIFVPDMRGGGAQKVAVNLCGGIAKNGYSVDLVLAEATGPYLYEIPDSVRLVDLKAPRILLSLLSLRRYLKHEQPDAILSFLNYANIVSVWARRLSGLSNRLVLSEHNTLSSAVQHAAGLKLRLMPLFIRCFYRWADVVVAVSKGVADDLTKAAGVSRNQIKVIYNPVVTPQLRAKVQAPIEHPWFENENLPVILSVGRLAEQKDFCTLIRAFARWQRNHEGRLLILGEGEERPKLEALVKQLNLEKYVGLPGFVPNPYPYMAKATMFVLSSKWEGLPTVLIEAMYCGVPVIATDCPSGPREILHNGRYGQLVPIGDVDSLARSIEAVTDGTRLSPPRESWQPFELETSVHHYVSILFGV